jgi:hypothetical protein
MLRIALILEAAVSVAFFAQPSYGRGDVADPMRRNAAAYAADPAQRCQNISGSQFWWTDPNCQLQRADQRPAWTQPPGWTVH